MSGEANARFAEYATSGAFNISLTRRQVGALMLFADRDEWSATGYDTLERKGLITVLPMEGRNSATARITAAGICIAQLCAMAGLTNAAPPEEAVEIERLHGEIAALRSENAELALDSRTLHARFDAMEIELFSLRAEKAGGRFPKPIITLKDPQPEKPFSAMRFMASEEVQP